MNFIFIFLVVKSTSTHDQDVSKESKSNSGTNSLSYYSTKNTRHENETIQTLNILIGIGTSLGVTFLESVPILLEINKYKFKVYSRENGLTYCK